MGSERVARSVSGAKIDVGGDHRVDAVFSWGDKNMGETKQTIPGTQN